MTVGPAFICGDANADLAINIFDVTYIITYLYLEGPPPLPPESADIDNSGEINKFIQLLWPGFDPAWFSDPIMAKVMIVSLAWA